MTVRFAPGVRRMVFFSHCLSLCFFDFSEDTLDIHLVNVTCEPDQHSFCVLRKQGDDASVVKPITEQTHRYMEGVVWLSCW